MTRKRLIALLIMLTVLIGISACGKEKDAGTGSAGSSKEPLTMTSSAGKDGAENNNGSNGNGGAGSNDGANGNGTSASADSGTSVTLADGSSLFQFESGDIAVSEDTGVKYLKGMILVYTLGEPTEYLQDRIMAQTGGEIVGRQAGMIPLLEIRTDKASFEELESICETLQAFPEVAFAEPEILLEGGLETVNTLVPDENPWSSDAANATIPDKGDENHPGGNDWWAEVIRAYSAWTAAGEITDPVPVGEFDSYFQPEHPDLDANMHLVSLELQSGSLYRHPSENGISVTLDDGTKTTISHGMHIAGVIAAENNNEGIRGIADRSQLYCVSHTVVDDSQTGNAAEFYVHSSPAQFSYYFSKLIGEYGVRVINYSMGLNGTMSETQFASSGEAGTYEEYLASRQATADAYARMVLRPMLMAIANGFDQYICVQSAGNGSKEGNGREPLDSGINGFFASITEKMFQEEMLAFAGEQKALNDVQKSRLQDLQWSDIRDRIIIVGASSDEPDGEKKYMRLDTSNYGVGIDLFAPGDTIYSTQTDGRYLKDSATSGTSMAAPMVTGSAALLWSMEPGLPPAEIKKILTECTDGSVDDAAAEPNTHPLLNVGLAAEYMKYYMFVRDVMIPEYGLQKGAQEGWSATSDDEWMEPEGIITAWIGNMDGQTGDEMVVFRFERDPESSYSDKRYALMLDLFTIRDGQVTILDTLNTSYTLTKKFAMDLEMNVSAAPRDDRTDILFEIEEEEKDLYGSTRYVTWVVTSDGETLTLQDGDAAAYETKDRIFDMSKKSSREDKARDHYTYLVTDGCRLTWYLDFVFTDKDYIPAGYVRDYTSGEAGDAAAASEQEAIQSVLWSNPPKKGTEPRRVRSERYQDGELKSFHQYAYDKDGLLLYDGYFEADGELSSITHYEYDDAGGLIRETEIDENGVINYSIGYENDDQGNQIRRYTIPEGGGEITDWDEYEYDSAGNQIKWRGYRKDELSFYWEYQYDAAGNKIGWQRYDADGTRTQAQTSEFDAEGHILSAHGVDDQNGSENLTTYEWTDNYHTRRSPWYYSNNGKLAGYDVYTYDDYGNVLSFRTLDADGRLQNEQCYIYD